MEDPLHAVVDVLNSFSCLASLWVFVHLGCLKGRCCLLSFQCAAVVVMDSLDSSFVSSISARDGPFFTIGIFLLFCFFSMGFLHSAFVACL